MTFYPFPGGPSGGGSGLTAEQAKIIAIDAQAQHPGVGGIAVPQLVNASGGSALSSGTMGILPITLMDGATWDAILVNITTAAVGGTYSLACALYPDPTQGNGTPAADAVPLGSGSITDLTTTGVKTLAFAAPTAVLPAGFYILAGLYIATAAPSPAPAAFAVNGSYINQSTSSSFGGYTTTRARGRRRNGTTSLAEGIAAAAWTAATGTECLALGLRRAS